MAVQLMPESAVCLLMVSLGGVQNGVNILSLSAFMFPSPSVCLTLLLMSYGQLLKQVMNCHHFSKRMLLVCSSPSHS